MPWTVYSTLLHISWMSLASAATSGRPVAAPALSAQFSIGLTSGLNSALSPTMANEFLHPSIRPFFDSSALSFESHVFTTSLRHPMPPLAFQYLANAFRASTLPWNRPGASGDPTSAITVTLMSVAVTPTSVSFSASDLHLSVAPAAVVLVPDALLLLFDLSLRPHETAIMP